jgi:hypothetical protein
MLAALCDVEELRLDPSEAARLSDAIREVQKHYAYTMDPRKVALLNLGATAIGIYGSRVMAYALKRRQAGKLTVMPGGKEKEEKPAEPVVSPDLTAAMAGARSPADLWRAPAL